MVRLTNEEISFLQWICENGGRRAVAGDIDFTDYRRVVDCGYVGVKPNRFSANTPYFTITKGGRQTSRSRQARRGIAKAVLLLVPAFPELGNSRR
jgi:hypothetical protein